MDWNRLFCQVAGILAVHANNQEFRALRETSLAMADSFAADAPFLHICCSHLMEKPGFYASRKWSRVTDMKVTARFRQEFDALRSFLSSDSNRCFPSVKNLFLNFYKDDYTDENYPDMQPGSDVMKAAFPSLAAVNCLYVAPLGRLSWGGAHCQNVPFANVFLRAPFVYLYDADVDLQSLRINFTITSQSSNIAFGDAGDTWKLRVRHMYLHRCVKPFDDDDEPVFPFAPLERLILDTCIVSIHALSFPSTVKLINTAILDAPDNDNSSIKNLTLDLLSEGNHTFLEHCTGLQTLVVHHVYDTDTIYNFVTRNPMLENIRILGMHRIFSTLNDPDLEILVQRIVDTVRSSGRRVSLFVQYDQNTNIIDVMLP